MRVFLNKMRKRFTQRFREEFHQFLIQKMALTWKKKVYNRQPGLTPGYIDKLRYIAQVT